MKLLKKIKTFAKENPILSALFAITTIFFLIQHYFNFTWDFAAYLANAKYLFYGGNYFEVYRAPLISIILAPLLLLGTIAPYAYVLLISALFFYSTIKLSNALFEKYFYKYNIKKKTINLIFYIFSLNFFVLIFGLIVGTELLALALFQLFLAYFILNKNSGHLLALTFLSRYNFFIFIPLLFINKSIKKIIKNLALFSLFIFPWLLFNKLKWGNWFTSIADSFYLNIFSRLGIAEAFQFSSILNVTNWLLPFFLIGLLVPIIILIRSKNKKLSTYKYEILFLSIFLLFLYDIQGIPFKITRYLFNLALPIAFFSTLGATFILINLKKSFKKLFTTALIVALLITMIIAAQYSFTIDSSDTMYSEAAQSIEELGLTECQILSPHWVPINYYNGNTRYLPYDIPDGLSKNEIMLIFYQYPTMDDQFDITKVDDYPNLIKTDNHIIIANENITNETCIKARGHSSPMTEYPCDILSKKFKTKWISTTFKKICDAIN